MGVQRAACLPHVAGVRPQRRVSEYLYLDFAYGIWDECSAMFDSLAEPDACGGAFVVALSPPFLPRAPS